MKQKYAKAAILAVEETFDEIGIKSRDKNVNVIAPNLFSGAATGEE